MTLNTSTQRSAAAGRSATAKVQTFLAGLTPDEQQVIELSLRRLVGWKDVSTGDTAGYATPMVAMGLLARLAAELDLYQKWAEAYESQR